VFLAMTSLHTSFGSDRQKRVPIPLMMPDMIGNARRRDQSSSQTLFTQLVSAAVLANSGHDQELRVGVAVLILVRPFHHLQNRVPAISSPLITA
jgi:hypothetical protein